MKKIFLLWIPLAAMWLMMGIEMPLINAFIARMPAATANLAAFGVTLSLALIIESPVIQMLTAGTALADSAENYRRLINFMHILAVSLTLIHLLLGLTPLYGLLLKYVIAVPEDIIPLSRKAFIWMFPWSAAVGYRRLWQGVLIRYGKTTVIPLTMIIRLIATASILVSGYAFPFFSGGEVGGIALSFGVIAGAVSSYVYVRPLIKVMPGDSEAESIKWRSLIDFYYPLALTNFVNFIVRPVLSFGIARAAFPLESLAIWPVVTSFMFLFRSMSMAYQEVAVSLLKSDSDMKELSRFALILGALLSLLFFAIAVSPLSYIWYRYAAGLGDSLIAFTIVPTLIVTAAPFFTGMTSWYRGVLIFRQKTADVARAVAVNSATLLIIILAGPYLFSVQGGIIAAAAFTLSLMTETIYLKGKTAVRSSV